MDRRDGYGWAIAVTGLVLAGIQLVQGVQQLDGLTGVSQTDQIIVFAFETLPFALIGLSLVYVGYWLTDQREYEPDLPQILAWGAGSTLLFASVGALILFSQQVTLNTLEQGQFLAMNLITVGAVVGVLVGIYDANGRARERELAAERDRIEAFAGKAADINNYGRELNRAQSVEEVSALCIEALQTLLGLTETGFLTIEGEEVTVINSTIVNADEESLAEIARETLGLEQGVAVRSDAVPAALDSQADGFLSMLVTAHDDSGVVLLAPVAETDEIGEEDLQLLELLVSHAGTALDGIHSERLTREELTS